MKYAVAGNTGFCGQAMIHFLQKKRIDYYPIPRECSYLHFYNDIDVVFNCTGIKGVENCNQNVEQCIDSNLIYLNKILDYSKRFDIRNVINLSSQKACNPNTIYGYSKFLGEKLIEEYNKKFDCKFKILRIANIINSPNSIIPKWKESIEKYGVINVANLNATRFFCIKEQVVEWMFQAIENENTLIIPNQKATTLNKLAECVIEAYGSGKNIRINETGLANYDSMHENLGPIQSNNVEQLTYSELFGMIC